MWDTKIAEGGIVYASKFTGDFSFLLSIVIGVIATFFVFKVARKMGGGLFGKVLSYVGFGMVLIIVGTISIALESFVPEIFVTITHNMFFALGFIFLAIGADKLLKGITN